MHHSCSVPPPPPPTRCILVASIISSLPLLSHLNILVTHPLYLGAQQYISPPPPPPPPPPIIFLVPPPPPWFSPYLYSVLLLYIITPTLHRMLRTCYFASCYVSISLSFPTFHEDQSRRNVSFWCVVGKRQRRRDVISSVSEPCKYAVLTMRLHLQYQDISIQLNLLSWSTWSEDTCINWNLWSGDTSIQSNLWSWDTSIQSSLRSGDTSIQWYL